MGNDRQKTAVDAFQFSERDYNTICKLGIYTQPSYFLKAFPDNSGIFLQQLVEDLFVLDCK